MKLFSVFKRRAKHIEPSPKKAVSIFNKIYFSEERDYKFLKEHEAKFRGKICIE